MTPYRSEGDYPIWSTPEGGTSCFLIPLVLLRTFLASVLECERGSADEQSAIDALNGALQASMQSNFYQGEVLITDGSLSGGALWQKVPDCDLFDMNDYAVPQRLATTDPQFVFCGERLWVYYDINNSGEEDLGCPGDTTTAGQSRPQDQLRRAMWVTAEEFGILADMGYLPYDYAEPISVNGDYTLFLALWCPVAFDMRELFETGPEADWDDNIGTDGPPCTEDALYGKMVADPDMAILDDGTVVARFFGGCSDPEIPSGLMFAYAEGNCEAVE